MVGLFGFNIVSGYIMPSKGWFIITVC